jgi:hypothetical protein
MPLNYINGVPVIEITGVTRALAALPPNLRLKTAFRSFKTVYPVVPRGQWHPVDYRWCEIKTKDQRQHGSCTGHASSTALEYHRQIAGMPKVELSATFPYAQANGGQDQGASVSGMMEILTQVGTCTAAECGVEQIFKNQIPPSAYETAKKFQLQEALSCRSFDEFGSALLKFGPVALGIVVGQNFARLDRNGIAPLPDVAAGGHALAGVGLKQINGQWYILIHNSWGTSFGFDGGFAYIGERHCMRMLDGFGLIVPRESKDLTDGDEPPVVPQKLAVVIPVQIVGVPETAPASAVEAVEAVEATIPEVAFKPLTLADQLGYAKAREAVLNQIDQEESAKFLQALRADPVTEDRAVSAVTEQLKKEGVITAELAEATKTAILRGATEPAVPAVEPAADPELDAILRALPPVVPPPELKEKILAQANNAPPAAAAPPPTTAALVTAQQQKFESFRQPEVAKPAAVQQPAVPPAGGKRKENRRGNR